MSVSKPTVSAALKRLAGKPFPPDTEEAMAEVVNTIARLAEDEAHVDRIIQKASSELGSYPEPAVFSVYADMTATTVSMADPLCKKCGGCGFVHRKIDGLDYSRKCDCWARRPKSLRPWAMGDND